MTIDAGWLRETAARASDRVALSVAIARRIEARRMLEVGVARGGFAAAMLRSCPDIAEYVMLDPWRRLKRWNKGANRADAAQEDAWRAAMARTAFAADRRRVLRGTTREMIGEIPDGSLDVIYVDGDHTLRGVILDLTLCWPKLRPGGVMIGDDFAPTIWQHIKWFEPTLVFPAAVHFAEAFDVEIFAAGDDQFVMPKAAGEDAPGFAFHDLVGGYHRLELLEQIRAAPPYPAAIDAALRGARRWLRRRRL